MEDCFNMLQPFKGKSRTPCRWASTIAFLLPCPAFSTPWEAGTLEAREWSKRPGSDVLGEPNLSGERISELGHFQVAEAGDNTKAGETTTCSIGTQARGIYTIQEWCRPWISELSWEQFYQIYLRHVVRTARFVGRCMGDHAGFLVGFTEFWYWLGLWVHHCCCDIYIAGCGEQIPVDAGTSPWQVHDNAIVSIGDGNPTGL